MEKKQHMRWTKSGAQMLAAEAYARMMSGNAEFHVVLTM